MKETLFNVGQYIPFLGMMISKQPGHQVVTRLIEAGIIGLVVMYGGQKMNNIRLDSLEKKMDIFEMRTLEQMDKLNVRMTQIQIEQARK